MQHRCDCFHWTVQLEKEGGGGGVWRRGEKKTSRPVSFLNSRSHPVNSLGDIHKPEFLWDVTCFSYYEYPIVGFITFSSLRKWLITRFNFYTSSNALLCYTFNKYTACILPDVDDDYLSIPKDSIYWPPCTESLIIFLHMYLHLVVLNLQLTADATGPFAPTMVGRIIRHMACML